MLLDIATRLSEHLTAQVNVSEGVVIFKFNSILYYANKDYFASKVQKAAGLANNKNKSEKSQLYKLLNIRLYFKTVFRFKNCISNELL